MQDLMNAQVEASQNRLKTIPTKRHLPTLTTGDWATAQPEMDCVFDGYDAEGLAIYRFTERFW